MHPLLIAFFVVLGLLILLIIGILFVVRSGLQGFQKALEGVSLAAQVATPARLHLRRTAAPGWTNPTEAEGYTGQLEALGFESSGAYTTDEIPGLRMAGYAKPDQSTYGLVYEHPQAGVFADLVTLYEEGTSLTYTTTDQGRGLDQRPGHGKVYAPELDVTALYNRLLAERPGRPLKPITTDGFAATFEQAYADEMDWRNARGGPTEDEIRAISGGDISDEDVAAVREVLAEQAAEGLHEALQEEFLARTTMSAEEWEEARDRVVYIHDRLDADQLAGELSLLVPERLEEQVAEAVEQELAAGKTPRDAAAAVLAQVAGDSAPEKLATLERPLPADVYLGREDAE